jgi:HK97 family phage prohead protease
MLETKRLPFRLTKADSAARTITGLAAAYSLDLGGDVIRPGAFSKTLSRWKSEGFTIYLLDSHDYLSIEKVVGKMVDATENNEGLLTTFEMLPAGDQRGDAAFNRAKGGYISGLSIGYTPRVTETPSEADRLKGIKRYLTEIDLAEVSLVVFPMNEDARIAAVAGKSGDAGRYALLDALVAREEARRAGVIAELMQRADA